MIHVVAIITAKPGQRETILAAARANLAAVRAEDGCIEYSLTLDAEGLGSFQTKFGYRRFGQAVNRTVLGENSPLWMSF